MSDQGEQTPGTPEDDSHEDLRDIPDRWFINRTGMRIAADVHGDPENPGVILIHGGGQTRHSWGGTAEALARDGLYAVAFDQRGHGATDRAPDRDYSLDRFAEDCIDVASEMEERSGVAPVIVGASLGGLALLLAEGELAPGTCRAIVLVDITPRMEPDGVLRIVEFMLDKVHEGYGSLEEAAEAIAEYQPHRKPTSDLKGLSKNLRRDPDGRWRWHWDPDFFLGPLPVGASQSHPRYEAATKALDVPTLLVRGRLSDLVSEETATEFLELCPDADFVDVSEAGHMVAGDRNDVFTDEVARWIEALAQP